MKQSETDKGREWKRKKWRVMQTVRKVFFYLLNPPAARHQRTAYLSATLTSSNRPGTVVNTHGTDLSHTPSAEDLTCCFSCDCHELKSLWCLNPAHRVWIRRSQGGDIDGSRLPRLTIELKECRRRIACPYRRVLCPPLCAACRAHKNTHMHKKRRSYMSSSSSWQTSPSGL